MRIAAKELVVLMLNAYKYNEQFGWDDAERLIEEVMSKVDRELFIEKQAIESLLYCSNMLDENKSFWHPSGKDFETMLSEVVSKHYKFNRTYNYLEKK